MMKLANQMDRDTRIMCLLNQWVAVDENCGEINRESNPVRLRRSAGRRKAGRPIKYYLMGTGAINAPVLLAQSDEDAVEMANDFLGMVQS